MNLRPLSLALSLLLAGCAADNTAMEDAAIEARIDSAVKARTDKLQADLQRQNDSLINDAARRRADTLLQGAAAAPQPEPAPVP